MKQIKIPAIIQVRKLSELADVTVAKIIGALIKNGVRASINESIDFDTASIICQDLGIEIVPEESEVDVKSANIGSTRPPVVTIMGHVDHGKTTLLDAIRNTNIVSKEAGGITQHIGAYQAKVKTGDGKVASERLITFLDTPGHEAFSAMRAHGASLTDIAVIVVAADDGVKPQTEEAISHAKAAGIPIVIAINKIDLPGADPERVKKELMNYGLTPEEWGGNTPTVEVSAKTNLGVNNLLEIIVLVADLAELKADPEGLVSGVVIDSHIETGAGPVATVLVQEGTLRVGDIIVVGSTWGKIKFIEDWLKNKITEALPSTPALISGLKSVPRFGESFTSVQDEKQARKELLNKTKVGKVYSVKDNIDTLSVTINIIIRADVDGSIEAVSQKIKDLSNKKVNYNIIESKTGGLSETDVNHAVTTRSVIVNFHNTILPSVKKYIKLKKVVFISDDIIYKIIEELEKYTKELIGPELVEKVIGKVKILEVFRHGVDQVIIGGDVTSGFVKPNLKAHLYRDEELLVTGKIISMKIEKNDVNEVKKGKQCGMCFVRITEEPLPPILVGDEVWVYKLEKVYS